MLFISIFYFTFVKSKIIGAKAPSYELISMKERIKQLMESLHMTQMNFAQFIGMSPASLSSIFNDRTKPTLNTVEAIKNKIPRINTEWLIFGTGSMYVEDNQEQNVAVDASHSEVEPVLDFGSEASVQSTTTSDPIIPHQFQNHHQEIVRSEIKYIDKPQRKITEIRVYFDDLTYETFEPKK